MTAERKSIRDWEEAALDAIAAGGLSSLAIPDLARTLGVTKGSFYWHFASLDELITAALRRWEADDRAVVAELESVRDPRERLRAAFTEAEQSRRAHALYVALSPSADKRAVAVLRRIAERRLAFLITAYTAIGLPPDEAENRALIAYLAYIGLMHIRKPAFPRRLARARREAFVNYAMETLIGGE